MNLSSLAFLCSMFKATRRSRVCSLRGRPPSPRLILMLVLWGKMKFPIWEINQGGWYDISCFDFLANWRSTKKIGKTMETISRRFITFRSLVCLLQFVEWSVAGPTWLPSSNQEASLQQKWVAEKPAEGKRVERRDAKNFSFAHLLHELSTSSTHVVFYHHLYS